MRGRADTLASKAERQERQHDRDGKRNGGVCWRSTGREIATCQEACNVDRFAIPLPAAVAWVKGEKDGENALVSIFATHPPGVLPTATPFQPPYRRSAVAH